MSIKSSRVLLAIAACAACFTVAGCDSAGSYRVGSIGSNAPGGGDSGGDVADNGGGGNTGGGNTGGGNNGGGAGGGGGGTGNGSDPTNPASGVLVSAGNLVQDLGGRHNQVAGVVNGVLPGASPVTGTVTAVLNDTGQTLIDLGNGDHVLVPDVRGTIGEVVGVNLGSKTIVSAADGSSLLGVSILSPTQTAGTLATLGVKSGGNPLTVQLPGLASATNPGSPSNPVNTVKGVVTGVTNGDAGGTTVPVVGGLLGSGGSTTVPVVGGLLGSGGTTPPGHQD